MQSKIAYAGMRARCGAATVVGRKALVGASRQWLGCEHVRMQSNVPMRTERSAPVAAASAEPPADEWAERVLARTSEGNTDHQSLGDATHQSTSSTLRCRGASLRPTVAVVGRPNVGKSALFNRMIGQKTALVADDAGVTRDRLFGVCSQGPLVQEFNLVDTGGLAEVPTEDNASDQLASIQTAGELSSGAKKRAGPKRREGEELRRLIGFEAQQAIADADVLLIVTDGQAGPTPVDEDLIRWLRQTFDNKPMVLAVNKCESPTVGFSQALDFWDISQGIEPIAVSAISGSGTADVLDSIGEVLPPASEPDHPKSTDVVEVEDEVHQVDVENEGEEIALAVVGRPNVGKSSLVNSMAGQKRSIVSGLDGTTRDSVDTVIRGVGKEGKSLRLVDTAGLRRRSSVKGSNEPAEPMSVGAALAAVRRSNVVALVTDASEGPSEQDYRIARFAIEAGRAMVIVANKTDLLDDHSKRGLEKVRQTFKSHFFSVPWATVLLSCTHGKGKRKAATDLITAAQKAGSEHKRRINTGTLNEVIQEACTWRPPPARGGKRGRVYYATQASTAPPTFVLFVNKPSLFPDDYRRFVERQLREAVGLEGTPLRLLWRERTRSQSRSSYSKLSATL